jgi:cytochrome c553
MKGGDKTMKAIHIAAVAGILLGWIFSDAFAAGNAEKGKALFNDPTFAGGVKACSTCHPDGNGLEKAGDKGVFHVMGKTQKSLEEAINACIVYASKGKAIDVKSDQMRDIVAYIKTLTPKKSAPAY